MKTTKAYILTVLSQLLSTCSLTVFAILPDNPTTLSLPNGAQNLNTASNQTQPPSLNALPSNPFDYQVPSSDITVHFFGYGTNLPASYVALCLLQAANTATTYIGQDESMGTEKYQYTSGTVRLGLYPSISKDLTWGKWAAAIRGITYFITRYEVMRMRFYIFEGTFTIGSGEITG
ncbi:hypothetical protein MMC28_008861 [Mycoblastus sanguinarius]|nr:hypothetical protein [Mycoblastus sanguinarius]